MTDLDRPHAGSMGMYEMLFQRHPDPLFVMDTSGAFLSANAAFETLTGYRLEELRELTYAPFVRDHDARRVEEHFVAAIGGEIQRYEAAGVDRHGRPFDVHVTNVPVTDGDGDVVAVLGIARDLSAQQAARAALEESEQRFRGLFEGSGSGIAITDLTGRFVDANPAYLSMLGYTLDELRQTDFMSVTHPEDRDPNAGHIGQLLTGEVGSFTFEKRYVTKSTDIVWVRAVVSLIRDISGDPLHITATTEDITQVKLATERLRRSERLQQLAGRLALVGGWSIEADDLTLYWSPEIYRILDAPDGEEPPLEQAVGMYPDEHRVRLDAALQACLTDGTPFDLELEVITLAGRRIPVRAIAEAVRDADDRIVRVVGAFQDITELRRATVEAEEATGRVIDTLESMTDAFFTVDRDWRFTFVNSRAGELLQRDPRELIGLGIWEEFPEAIGTSAYDAYQAAMGGQGTQQIDDYYFPPLDTWFSILAYPSEQGLAVYFRDVSRERALRVERDEREAVLRRQAALIDEAQDAILVRDLDHRITFWNAGAQRIYGWTTDEAIGVNIRDMLYQTPDAFDTATAEVLTRGSWTGDLTQYTRAGEQVIVAGRWTLLRDSDGNAEAVLAINTDVTDQRRTEQQLLRAQRMESIGTLASGVAHDLNNVLSPILLAAELLQVKDHSVNEADLLGTIVTSAQRGADLVTQVLSFARGIEGERSPIDVQGLLDDTQRIVFDTFPKNITTRVEIPPQLPPVVGDATQIQQILLNLAVNARDAMPSGGTLTLRTTVVDIDDQYLAATPDATPGTYLRIEVEDTGTGMHPDILERVFEPFFTTKPHGAGTGLGLSTSAAIIKSHGGFMHVYSEPGKGSQFRLYIPTSSDHSGHTFATRGTTPLPRGLGQLILVVDDEAAVCTMTRHTLEAYGYRTLEAANGAEAISRFAQHQSDIALVLTDMMMPIMDGPATIYALRDIDPNITIVGASGLQGNGKVAQAAAAGVTHFIPKPYTTETLLTTIAAALDDPHP